MSVPTPGAAPSNHDVSARMLAPATIAVTAGRPPHDPDQPLNTPITLAATYVAGGELEYGRYGNPSWTAFEEALGALEFGRALSFSSGLAAVDTLLGLVGHGAKVVAPAHAYNGTVMQLADLAARGRLEAVLVDITDLAAVTEALEDAAMLWLESPTNPALEVIDLKRAIGLAHAAGAIVVVDNTFATPIGQQPLTLGADVVVHSVTKFIAGHSDVVMGAIVTGDDEIFSVLKNRRDLVGNSCSPLEAFLALRGLRTLPLRYERASANAAALAERLTERPEVEQVRYPGFGAIISVVLAGGAMAGDVWTTSTSLWVRATSLGGVESTFERRRRWRTEAATIPEGLVRLSVGIEDVEDLWADLVVAFTQLAAPLPDASTPT